MQKNIMICKFFISQPRILTIPSYKILAHHVISIHSVTQTKFLWAGQNVEIWVNGFCKHKTSFFFQEIVPACYSKDGHLVFHLVFDLSFAGTHDWENWDLQGENIRC